MEREIREEKNNVENLKNKIKNVDSEKNQLNNRILELEEF